MLPGVPQRATHDYKRHGTSSLYAALDLANRKEIGKLHSRHGAIEFKKFLTTIDERVPAHLEVHLVLDNASTHKTLRSNAGCSRTPASSCTSHRSPAAG